MPVHCQNCQRPKKPNQALLEDSAGFVDSIRSGISNVHHRVLGTSKPPAATSKKTSNNAPAKKGSDKRHVKVVEIPPLQVDSDSEQSDTEDEQKKDEIESDAESADDIESDEDQDVKIKKSVKTKAKSKAIKEESSEASGSEEEEVSSDDDVAEVPVEKPKKSTKPQVVHKDRNSVHSAGFGIGSVKRGASQLASGIMQMPHLALHLMSGGDEPHFGPPPPEAMHLYRTFPKDTPVHSRMPSAYEMEWKRQSLESARTNSAAVSSGYGILHGHKGTFTRPYDSLQYNRSHFQEPLMSKYEAQYEDMIRRHHTAAVDNQRILHAHYNALHYGMP